MEQKKGGQRIRFTIKQLLDSFVEVQEAPQDMAKELVTPPLSNLLSQYVVRPVNWEANPFQAPQPTYPKGNQFSKGYKKPRDQQTTEESKTQGNLGFFRNQKSDGRQKEGSDDEGEEEEEEEFEVVKNKERKVKSHKVKPLGNKQFVKGGKQTAPKQSTEAEAPTRQQKPAEDKTQTQQQQPKATKEVIPDDDYGSFSFGDQPKQAKPAKKEVKPVEQVSPRKEAAPVVKEEVKEAVKEIVKPVVVKEEPKVESKEEFKAAPKQPQQVQQPPAKEVAPKKKAAAKPAKEEPKAPEFAFTESKAQAEPKVAQTQSLEEIMQQQAQEKGKKKQQKTQKPAAKGEMSFDYIKASEDEIFKNLPKQKAAKQGPVSDPMKSSGYANLEDIMKQQKKK